MTTPVARLDLCYKCNEPFVYKPPAELMTTVCCYKVFHLTCVKAYTQEHMKKWKKNVVPCPACPQHIHVEKYGKPFETIWKVFTIALTHYPQVAQKIFNQQSSLKDEDSKGALFSNSECGICYNEMGQVEISYHSDQNRFAHTKCENESTSSINLGDLATLTKELVKEHPELASHFSFLSPKKNEASHYCTLT